ncbi:unnamed protein product [Orchesella dallaii]|uniref:Gustatory receptor n=1 Tax=Orchesella dallaii TaxID=48710 RepID=A0ABP1PWH5_9HEXA
MSEDLLSLGRWASLSVQIIGYFPLASTKNPKSSSTTTSKTFKFTWASLLPYYSCLLTAASFSWCFVYFYRYKEFKSFIDFQAPTEVAAYNLMIITSTLSGIYIKIFSLVHGKKYQEFWEHTTSLLDKFHYESETSRGLFHPLINASGFQKIRSSCRLEFFMMIIPVILHVGLIYGWSLVATLLDDSVSNTDTELYLGLGFWTVGALLHVGNAIWMNFFVKIYTECLHSISIDLKRLKVSVGRSFQNRIPDDRNLYRNGLVQPILMHETHPDDLHKHGHGEGSRKMNENLKISLDRLTLVDHEIIRFNEFFGNFLLIQVGNCVMNLLAFSFFACLWTGRGNWSQGMETLVPLYIYGKELLDMGSVAEELSSAAENVLDALAEDVMLDYLTEELYLKVMSALATFLVVLVQFRDQDDADAKLSGPSASTTTTTSSSLNKSITPADPPQPPPE